jgi:hypothetical protein
MVRHSAVTSTRRITPFFRSAEIRKASSARSEGNVLPACRPLGRCEPSAVALQEHFLQAGRRGEIALEREGAIAEIGVSLAGLVAVAVEAARAKCPGRSALPARPSRHPGCAPVRQPEKL